MDNVKHNYIRYANCWEDADILLEGLQIEEGDNVLSIGSAGDNSFSLLTRHPSRVVVVDVNLTQLYLIELKRAGFLCLEYEELLGFLGFKASDNRSVVFKKLAKELSQNALNYWRTNIELIENGVIYQGKFENYFRLFRKKVLPFIHTDKRINELISTKSAEDQRLFYHEKWNNWRWTGLFKLFFSRNLMGRLGRDPAFLKEVEGSVSSFILKQSANHLSSVNCQNNYFLNFILKGAFDKTLPHYIRKENFEDIRANLNKLVLVNGFADKKTLKEYTGFDRFNLSNIFEYMGVAVFNKTVKELLDLANPHARLAYWNLMVNRSVSKTVEGVRYEDRLSKELRKKDNGFFYKGIVIDSRGSA